MTYCPVRLSQLLVHRQLPQQFAGLTVSDEVDKVIIVFPNDREVKDTILNTRLLSRSDIKGHYSSVLQMDTFFCMRKKRYRGCEIFDHIVYCITLVIVENTNTARNLELRQNRLSAIFFIFFYFFFLIDQVIWLTLKTSCCMCFCPI